MKINLKNKNTLSWGWSNSVYGILYTPAVLFALKILWLFHKRWNVSPVVRNIFQWSPFIVSALLFFSVVIIQWPVLKLVGTTWGAPWAPSSLPELGPGLWPPPRPPGSLWGGALASSLWPQGQQELDLSFLAPLSGSLLQLQSCTNQTAHLGPSFSTGLGPNSGAYFTFTSSTTGTCVFSGPTVPTTNFIKSLPAGTVHCAYCPYHYCPCQKHYRKKE